MMKDASAKVKWRENNQKTGPQRWEKTMVGAMLAEYILSGALATKTPAVAPVQSFSNPPVQRKMLSQSKMWIAAAQYLKMSPEDLRDKWRQGQSLAAIAQARGQSVSGLEQAMIIAGQARIAAEQSAGKITAAQAATMKARLPMIVARLVRMTPQEGRGWAERGHANRQWQEKMWAAAAQYLKTSPEDLRSKWRQGQSLAAIAQAQGQSVSGLKQAMMAAGQAYIAAEQSAGKITAEQAAMLQARLPERVAHQLNKVPSAHWTE
ncbi:MAG: hypothetical protein OWS74_01690 [Firmicutes bacterium]|nr:hypothetical protein [Bacillota bacterium]